MLMIGVSTAQNITNLIPAVSKGLGTTDFLLLETSTAKKNQWSEGLRAVLEGRGINVESLGLEGIDSNIVEIKERVLKEVTTIRDPVIWNLGGGQKPQQIPLWEIFRERNASGISDQVCYANQDIRDHSELEIWKVDSSGSLWKDAHEIEVDLTAHEVFKVFNFDVRNTTPIYGKVAENIREVKDLMAYKEFRRFLVELPQKTDAANGLKFADDFDEIKDYLQEKRTLVEDALLQKLWACSQLINQRDSKGLSVSLASFLIGNSRRNGEIVKWLQDPISIKGIPINDLSLRQIMEIPDDQTEVNVTPDTLEAVTGDRKAADYFEKIVVQRVRNLLNNRGHKIVEGHANLEIVRDDNPEIIVAEYDVLCVTNKGTIVAFDAKTFDFENKDIDARLYNLEQGSGFYRTFSAVIPLDYEDVGSTYLPKELVNLTFKLSKRMSFFVVSYSTKGKSFWITKRNGIVEKTLKRPKERDWVECKPLDNVFI